LCLLRSLTVPGTRYIAVSTTEAYGTTVAYVVLDYYEPTLPRIPYAGQRYWYLPTVFLLRRPSVVPHLTCHNFSIDSRPSRSLACHNFSLAPGPLSYGIRYPPAIATQVYVSQVLPSICCTRYLPTRNPRSPRICTKCSPMAHGTWYYPALQSLRKAYGNHPQSYGRTLRYSTSLSTAVSTKPTATTATTASLRQVYGTLRHFSFNFNLPYFWPIRHFLFKNNLPYLPSLSRPRLVSLSLI